MSKRLCFGTLLSVLGAGLFLLAQPAWAVNTIPATCTPSPGGPPSVLPSCLTDPAFPNTWFTPAQFPGVTPGENEPFHEATTTLTLPGKTFTNVGLFNILDPASEGGGISDQVQLVHAAGGDQIIITGDPFTPLPGGTTLATEGANGVVASLPVGFVGGGGFTAIVGSDGENPFNPIGVGGGQDLSDFVQLTPEPSTIALLASGLVGLGFMRPMRSRKRRVC